MGFYGDIKSLCAFLKEELTEDSKKEEAILEVKKTYEIEETFGEKYNSSYKDMVKERGQIYTPEEIVQYMCSESFKDINMGEIYNLKICDPSCGTGNFTWGIVKFFEKKLSEEGVSEEKKRVFIDTLFQKVIYIYDIDETAINCLQIDLYISYKKIIVNANNKDFLFSDVGKFDFIIGNPPYIGHKGMEKEYKKRLKDGFSVYRDKGDISYCFIQKGIDSINKKGQISLITSRYFLEALSGEELREHITKFKGKISIVDFYGIRPFKGIGIDPVIINLKENGKEESPVEVVKPLMKNGQSQERFLYNLFGENEEVNRFNVGRKRLGRELWCLIDDRSFEIIRKIRESSSRKLGELMDFHQGIITGCDRAFIIKKDQEELFENYLILPWVKNSDIRKGEVRESEKRILYMDILKEEDRDNSRAIKHVEQYRERLEKRRECKKGLREWYQLQWGRKLQVFKGEKIIFPYKSESNRFALDKESLFSADVYCMSRKVEEMKLDRLTKLLNSKLYEFYMKCTSKKLGKNIYEYYPNRLKHIRVLDIIMEEVDINDEIIYEHLNFNKVEIEIIESMCK